MVACRKKNSGGIRTLLRCHVRSKIAARWGDKIATFRLQTPRKGLVVDNLAATLQFAFARLAQNPLNARCKLLVNF